MRPRAIIDGDLAYWADVNPRAAMFSGPTTRPSKENQHEQ